jgi:hypothetical protein
MAGGLLNMFKTDTGIIGKLTDAGKSAGTTIGGGITNTAQNTGDTFGSKFSAGLTKAYPYIEAAIVGWQIGTLIYNAAQPAIDEITDYLSGLGKSGGLSVEDITEANKSSKTRWKMYQTQEFIKKWGLNYKIDRKDIENNSAGYKNLREVMTIAEKYPSVLATYSPSRLIDDPELRERILKGNLPKGVTTATPHIKTTSEKLEDYKKSQTMTRETHASGMPSYLSGMNTTTNIYLDTGKLVGGTSRTSATQNNYAMRGYAI